MSPNKQQPTLPNRQPMRELGPPQQQRSTPEHQQPPRGFGQPSFDNRQQVQPMQQGHNSMYTQAQQLQIQSAHQALYGSVH
jgi:hypothetical protein